MSRPLRRALHQSDRIVRNIGGNLLDGMDLAEDEAGFDVTLDVETDDSELSAARRRYIAVCGGVRDARQAFWQMYADDPGEVAAMSHQFTCLLMLLRDKHEQQQLSRRANNPFKSASAVFGTRMECNQALALSVLGGTALPKFTKDSPPPQLGQSASKGSGSKGGSSSKGGSLHLPFTGQPKAPTMAPFTGQPKAKIARFDAYAAKKKAKQMRTQWNGILCQLSARLVLPMVLAVIACVSVTTSTVLTDLEIWTAPVNDQMVSEELVALDKRVYEEAMLLATLIGSYTNGLAQMHTYAEALFISPDHGSGEDSSGSGTGGGGGEGSGEGGGGSTIRFTSSPPPSYYFSLYAENGAPEKRFIGGDTYPDGTVSYLSSVWGRGKLVDPSEEDPLALVDPEVKHIATPPATAVLAEQRLAGHMDNVFRPTFFATGAEFVYMAFEGSEVYRQVIARARKQEPTHEPLRQQPLSHAHSHPFDARRAFVRVCVALGLFSAHPATVSVREAQPRGV